MGTPTTQEQKKRKMTMLSQLVSQLMSSVDSPPPVEEPLTIEEAMKGKGWMTVAEVSLATDKTHDVVRNKLQRTLGLKGVVQSRDTGNRKPGVARKEWLWL